MMTINYIHEYAVNISIGNSISVESHQKVISLYEYFKKNAPIDLIDAVPAYCSLGLYFKKEIYNRESNLLLYVENIIKKIDILELENKVLIDKTPIVLDVDYCGEDLERVANECGLEKGEIIEIHSKPVYTVAMIGFLPGFPYMLGLDEKLFLSRKTTPSLKIKKGSVAIGGKQTGIYPIDSPGGWHVLGYINQDLFSVKFSGLTFFKPGDKVIFKPKI